MMTTSYPYEHAPPPPPITYPPRPYQTTPGGLVHPFPSRRTRAKHRSVKAAKAPHEDTYEVDTARPKFGEQARSTYKPRKNGGTPTPPRWAGVPAGLGQTHLKRRTEHVQFPFSEIENRWNDHPRFERPTPPGEILNAALQTAEVNKQLEQQRKYRKEYLNDVWTRPHEPPVQPDRPGTAERTASPSSQMMIPAMMQQQRTAQQAFMHQQQQQALSTYLQGRIGSQKSMANLKQGQAQQPRAMGNGQTWHDPFIYPPPNINKSVVGNGRSVFDQHTAPRQRPESPPLTGFDHSPDPHSRTSRVSGPPASLPRHGTTGTASGQAPFINIPPHLLQQQQMNQQPGDPRHDAALTHLQAQQYQEMLMQQRQLAHQNSLKHNSNGLIPSPSSFYPEWGFGRDSNMLPSPSTLQTPGDPNGPSFAPDDYAERKSKTFDQCNIPVQPNDERRDSPRPFKNTRILCSVYRFPQGKVQSTISEDHTTDVSKRRKLNFMALGQSKSYGAKIEQHPRRDAEPNGRMRALIKV